MTTIRQDNGFTLLEVLIALAIFATAFISFLMMTSTSIKGNSDAFRVTSGGTLGADSIERILTFPYDSHNNGEDDDGDGNNDNVEECFNDSDGDGNAAANNRGLDDTDGANAADYSVITADGNYVIFWNVAEDYPDVNMKTIRIIVRNRLLGRDIVLTNLKIRNT